MVSAVPKDPQPRNRLDQETSPYLLQHVHNPVAWQPWDQEALEQARKRDRPILLSIGYSACHWCHVMERESFEDEEIAGFMNEHFVNIKVDREERPDLDSIYMAYVQMATGQGGWPLTVFLTPELDPFFGGTYFPPTDKFGRPGFKTVLQKVAQFYAESRDKILENRDQIRRRLEAADQVAALAGKLDEAVLDRAFHGLLQQLDNRYGGFGNAPKFPSAMALGFLLRYYQDEKIPSALEAVELSLQAMARGGIFDQLGGGFHRYSVDAEWLVPHFEKMLYDNALLALLYTEAFQLTANSEYARVARETLKYVQRDMTAPCGGFYSAEDADSEGVEGKFYVWSLEEVQQVLEKEEAELVSLFYDVTESGNWEGKNILRQLMDVATAAQRLGISQEEFRQRRDSSRQKLLEHRNRRVRPGLDDKILAGWNGLMLRAFSRAGFVFGSDEFRATAEQNAGFILDGMFLEGVLFRTWKEGEARLPGYLEDYAAVAAGLLDLYQTSGDLRWLEGAEEITRAQIDFFYDPEQGDFYFTSSEHRNLLVRQKEYFDNATPSGNSTSALNLLLLGKLLDEPRYTEMAEQILNKMSSAMSQYPSAFGNWLQAAHFMLSPAREIAAVGEDQEVDELLDPLRGHFGPNIVMARTSEVTEKLSERVPLLKGKTRVEDRAAIYICENFACRQPFTSAAGLRDFLMK